MTAPPRPDFVFTNLQPHMVTIAAYITYLEQELESCQAALDEARSSTVAEVYAFEEREPD